MKDVVYFSINHWSSEYYPDTPIFNEWLADKNLFKYFSNEDWVEENELIVVESTADMSIIYVVSATRKWCEKNCPEVIGSKFDMTEKVLSGKLKKDSRGNYLDDIWEVPIIEYDENKIGEIYFYDAIADKLV